MKKLGVAADICEQMITEIAMVRKRVELVEVKAPMVPCRTVSYNYSVKS
jgi:hypothetical protein